MRPKQSLSGHPPVTLISGYRGLAETFLSQFSAAGHALSVLVRRPSVVSELQSKYPAAHFHVGDFVDPGTPERWFHAALERFGRVDCLVNNAAITGPAGLLHENDMSDFETAVRVNFLAPATLCHLALRFFTESKQGVIVNLSGGGATSPRPRFCAYATTKTALVRLTETLAREYCEDFPDLRFYSIAPGTLKTPMLEGIVRLGKSTVGREYDDVVRKVESGAEDPAKAARLALWLCERRPGALSGRLISAVWDNYEAAEVSQLSKDWWTLRRVDSVLLDAVSERSREHS